MLPPTASLTYSLTSGLPAQRTPWPKATPVLRALPWSRTEPTVAFSPAVVKTRVGLESSVSPAPLSEAPPVASSLSQPRPGPDGGFEHGHGPTPAAAARE